MQCNKAYTAIIQGIIDGESKHVLLNNIASSYLIDFSELEEFHTITIKLVKKIKAETVRDV